MKIPDNLEEICISLKKQLIDNGWTQSSVSANLGSSSYFSFNLRRCRTSRGSSTTESASSSISVEEALESALAIITRWGNASEQDVEHLRYSISSACEDALKINLNRHAFVTQCGLAYDDHVDSLR